ncbi:Coenzyme F420 hydrogenase/dehydrogenase, beta subunit C-terminal domain [Methanocaldococcus infernus]
MEWKLKDEIVDTEMCAQCSTCAIVCPNNLVKFDEKPYLGEECLRKGHGMCYEVCPRVNSFKYQVKIRERFKEEYYYAKGDIEGQDGGVVTTFLKYLLEKGEIDGAIVVGGDEYWKPVSMVVQTAEDIVKGAKSKYTVSTLEALRKAGELGLKKVAVVGLPCQINGLRKLQYFPYHSRHDFEIGKDGKPVKLPKIEYFIGLFCTKKFEYDNFKEVLEKYGVNIKDVEKFDIKKGKLLVYLKNEVKEIPIKEFKPLSGCKVCKDFTAELSDISVGSVGSPEGYTTVIIRTKKGEKIKEALELKEGVDIEKIKKLAEKKVKEFKEEIEKRRKEGKKISLYWLGDYGGVKKEPTGSYFIRVRAKPGQWYSVEELEKLTEIAKKYNLRVKLTNRGTFEYHGADGFEVENIIKEINEAGFITGSEGPLVRAILACPGEGNCGSGLIKTYELAELIEEEFKEYPTPNKFKIAISGCPSSCIRAQIHDIGIIGVKYPKVNDNCNGCGRCYEVCKLECIYIRGSCSYTNYNICIGCGKCIKACPNEAREVLEEGYIMYIGGRGGKKIVEGFTLKVKDVEEMKRIIRKTIELYNKYAIKPQRERLSDVIKRVGKINFIRELMS